MKIKVLTLSAFLIISFVHAQEAFNLKITYSISEQKNKDIPQNIDRHQMVLLLGESSSSYVHPKKLTHDSIMLAWKEGKTNLENMSQDQIQNLVNSIPKTPKIPLQYIISKTQDSLKFTTKAALDTFIYYEKLPDFNWIIDSEEKQLIGYTCNKASGFFRGRNYIAWFTSEISSSNGPHKFGGLPGLILEIHDTENNYTFKAQSIEIKSGIMPKHSSTFNVEITSAEKIKDAAFNTYISSVHAMISDPERQAKIIARETKKYENSNNPLELVFESEK